MTQPETPILRRIQLRATEIGARLFRNNVGSVTYTDRHGQPRTVKYGLHVGSSDLIGWTPHVVTAADIGRTLAIFTAVEVKTLRGTPTPEQITFIEAVRRAGGIAGVARSPDELPTLDP